jgi:hypothetical protein
VFTVAMVAPSSLAGDLPNGLAEARQILDLGPEGAEVTIHGTPAWGPSLAATGAADPDPSRMLAAAKADFLYMLIDQGAPSGAGTIGELRVEAAAGGPAALQPRISIALADPMSPEQLELEWSAALIALARLDRPAARLHLDHAYCLITEASDWLSARTDPGYAAQLVGRWSAQVGASYHLLFIDRGGAEEAEAARSLYARARLLDRDPARSQLVDAAAATLPAGPVNAAVSSCPPRGPWFPLEHVNP